jgi:Ca2+-binding EF-hand superfamily protein
VFDREKSGKISKSKIAHMLKLGNEPVAEEELAELFKFINLTENDQEITVNKLINMFMEELKEKEKK